MRVAGSIGISGAAGDTAHKCRQSLHPVNQALLQQEIQRAVYGRRRRTPAALAQPVEQLVGAGRRRAIQDHAEYVPAQFRQLCATVFADGLGPIEQVFGPS